MSSPDMLTTKRINFPKKVKALCRFCGGKSCAKENWKKCEKPAIQGLHSNWITDDIIASQRLSNRLIEQYDIMGQFRDLGVKAVLNLEQPGEHPYCGDGIYDPKVGFSYNPETLYLNNMFFFNLFWKDLTNPDIITLLQAVQFLDFTISQGGKILVHCHAGQGRTGTIIAAYLVMYRGFTSREAISLVREKRKGALKKQYNRKCVIKFEKDLQTLTTLFPSEKAKKITLEQALQYQSELLHGQESRQHKNVPKLLNIILDELEEFYEGQEYVKTGKGIVSLSNAITLSSAEGFSEQALERMKTLLNKYRFECLTGAIPSPEPDRKRSSKLVLNDISMRTIQEVSRQDFKGVPNELSEQSRELVSEVKKNATNGYISAKTSKDSKFFSPRQSVRNVKHQSLPHMSGATPRGSMVARVHISTLCQLFLDFFEGLKTRVVDKQLFEIFQNLQRDQMENVVCGRGLRLRLAFLDRLSRFCNKMKSDIQGEGEGINFNPNTLDYQQETKATYRKTLNSQFFNGFMRRIAIALLHLKEEEVNHFNDRVLIGWENFKNENEIQTVVQGILHWREMLTLSPQNTISPSKSTVTNQVPTTSTFSKTTIMKIKMAEQPKMEESSEGGAESSIERALLREFENSEKIKIRKDISIKSTAQQ